MQHPPPPSTITTTTTTTTTRLHALPPPPHLCTPALPSSPLSHSVFLHPPWWAVASARDFALRRLRERAPSCNPSHPRPNVPAVPEPQRAAFAAPGLHPGAWRPLAQPHGVRICGVRDGGQRGEGRLTRLHGGCQPRRAHPHARTPSSLPFLAPPPPPRRFPGLTGVLRLKAGYINPVRITLPSNVGNVRTVLGGTDGGEASFVITSTSLTGAAAHTPSLPPFCRALRRCRVPQPPAPRPARRVQPRGPCIPAHAGARRKPSATLPGRCPVYALTGGGARIFGLTCLHVYVNVRALSRQRRATCGAGASRSAGWLPSLPPT
jgi:hypothetical protein